MADQNRPHPGQMTIQISASGRQVVAGGRVERGNKAAKGGK